MRQPVFKGSITVFLSISLVLIMALVGGMLQSSVIQANRSMARANTKLALESVFAEYNKELFQQYGILGKLGRNEKEISRRLWFYGANDMEHKIKKMQLLTDGEGQCFYEQAIRVMGGKSVQVKEVSEETVQKEEQENTEKLESILEEHGVELPVENNPIESIKQLKKSSLLSLILPNSEEISNRYIKLEELPSKRNLVQGKGVYPNRNDNSAAEKMLFASYLEKHFVSFTDETKNYILFYETEYILAGEESDQANLEAVARKILGLRMMLNYTYLLTDSEKKMEAELLAMTLAVALNSPVATEVVKQAILFSWAYGESILDLRNLYQGRKVSSIKTKDDWQLALENLSSLGEQEIQEEKEPTKGMTYDDYIKALMLLEKKETLSVRALDLIELNLGIRMDGLVTALDIESTLEMQMGIKDVFSTKFLYK